MSLWAVLMALLVSRWPVVPIPPQVEHVAVSVSGNWRGSLSAIDQRGRHLMWRHWLPVESQTVTENGTYWVITAGATSMQVVAQIESGRVLVDVAPPMTPAKVRPGTESPR